MKVAKDSGEYGDELNLSCAKHAVRAAVRKPEDFIKNAPLGGCTKFCKSELPCGHICPKLCHGEVCEYFPCLEKCQRKCDAGHDCPGENEKISKHINHKYFCYSNYTVSQRHFWLKVK